jgi:hypothetical protein
MSEESFAQWFFETGEPEGTGFPAQGPLLSIQNSRRGMTRSDVCLDFHLGLLN